MRANPISSPRISQEVRDAGIREFEMIRNYFTLMKVASGFDSETVFDSEDHEHLFGWLALALRNSLRLALRRYFSFLNLREMQFVFASPTARYSNLF